MSTQYPVIYMVRAVKLLGVYMKQHAVMCFMHTQNCFKTTCRTSHFITMMQETEEFGNEVSKSMERANSQVGILASDFPSTSYIGKDHRASETTQQGFPMNFVESVEGIPYSNWIQDSLEDQLLEKIEESNFPNKTALEEIADSVVQDSQESNGRHEIYIVQDSQESNGGHEIYVVQDSQESNDVHEVDACVKSHSSFQDNINSMTHQILDLAQNTSVENDSLAGKREQPASESQEQNDKKRKLMSETGGPSRRLTRRMLKETCV
uniref:Uncharacterized protein n=1 Tax=Medicago truncatula TaxID=3880 RepID=Q2HVA7_MEDTR|nr:hypothetical protein MtrDRAFT_AC148971g2v2 [Medicago truncatula]